MGAESQEADLFRTAVDAAADAIVVADASGVILTANPAAERLFGYSGGEMAGRGLGLLMPGAPPGLLSGSLPAPLDAAAQVMRPAHDAAGRRKDGTEFPLHLSLSRAAAGGGHVFVAVMHDLTAERASQEALARARQLDAIGRMTGGLAREFNDLLTVIIGNLELLDMRVPDGRLKQLIRDADASARIGADIASRLMIFSRSGDLRPETVDLRDLCASILSVLQPALGPGCRFATDFAPRLSLVSVDPVQLHKALMNLALNARHAMPEGGQLLISLSDMTVEDATETRPGGIAPGRYVRLSITDKGKGMDIEAQRHAFEPFFTTRGDSGVRGLGLAMVHGFVRQSGGHATLHSVAGHGTSVALYFPAVPDPAGSAEMADAEADMPPVPAGRGETVLVVSGDPVQRRVSMERIAALGFRPVGAASGDEAHRILRSGAPVDAVFSELLLPGGLNGYDLAERIAAEFPGVGVLLTSGHAANVVFARPAGGRSHDILRKPYRIQDLARRLQAVLSGPAS